MNRLTATTITLVAALTGSPAFAQPALEPARQARIDGLIAKLGDRDFAAREAAGRELLAIGRDARPAVLNALQESPVPEIAARCESLLPKIDFNFCWDRVSRSLGGTPEARRQFYEMYATESALWYAMAEGNPDLGKMYAARCAELAAGPARRTTLPGAPTEPMTNARYDLLEGRLQTLLVIGAECRRQIPEEALGAATRLLKQKWGGQYARDTPAALRTSYVVWAEQIGPLPIEYEGEKRLELARAVLRSNSPSTRDRQDALLTVARARDGRDDDLISGFLTDEAVCDTLFRKGVKTQVRVRDVALAATIYRAGKDPGAFGFKAVQPDPDLIFRPSSLGFAGADDRAEAFRAWTDAAGKER